MTVPLVSVIVAAFDAERTLEETLRSAQAQTVRDIEIIVVDDGSRDGTAPIAERFAAEDDRITLIRQANRGVSHARNAGIARSTGAWIAPLDADDVWHPEKLARQIEAAAGAATPPGFVYTYFRRIDEAGAIVGSGGAYCVDGPAIHRHLFRNFVGNGSAVLMRRAALDEAGGYDESVMRSEDYLLQIAIARRHPILCVPEYLVGYRIMPGSKTSDREAMFAAWRALTPMLRASSPRGGRAALRWADGKRCLDMAEYMAARGRYRTSVALLARAALADPAWTTLNMAYWLARGLRRHVDSVARPAEAPVDFFDAPTDAPIARDPREAVQRTDRLRRLEARRFERLAGRDRRAGP